MTPHGCRLDLCQPSGRCGSVIRIGAAAPTRRQRLRPEGPAHLPLRILRGSRRGDRAPRYRDANRAPHAVPARASVWVGHENGLRTHYEHLSQILVSVGQQAAAGLLVDLSGSTGKSTGPHLHFSVYVNRQTTDPVVFCEEKGLRR